MIHAKSNPPADPVCLEISAATIKIPEPIMDPTTIIVPSNNPMARTKPPSRRDTLDAVDVLIYDLSVISSQQFQNLAVPADLHTAPHVYPHSPRAKCR